MIDVNSLSANWLDQKRGKYQKDPSIMESMIHALYLLAQLKATELDFIFKGGTSLVLLMERPARFSVDIDVIVDPNLTKEELEGYLGKIVESSEFIRMELDTKRSYKDGIPKAHYKFIYRSNVSTKTQQKEVIQNPEREILLDVLFADNPYPRLVERPIQTDWVLITGEPLLVKTPDINSIAGDKLVAFAPSTTGVPYGVEKEKEIIKQLFDVGMLFHLIDDMEVFRASYHISAQSEITYRPERNIESAEAVLRDTIATGIILAKREHHDPADEDTKMKFGELNKGINQFGHFVFTGSFRIDHAQIASAKAAYLAAIILTGHNDKLQLFDEKTPISEYLIQHPEYNFLNKRLKAVGKGEALYYWSQTIKLLYA